MEEWNKILEKNENVVDYSTRMDVNYKYYLKSHWVLVDYSKQKRFQRFYCRYSINKMDFDPPHNILNNTNWTLYEEKIVNEKIKPSLKKIYEILYKFDEKQERDKSRQEVERFLHMILFEKEKTSKLINALQNIIDECKPNQ